MTRIVALRVPAPPWCAVPTARLWGYPRSSSRIWKTTAGPGSLQVARVLNELGVACKFAGRLDEAEAYYTRPTASEARQLDVWSQTRPLGRPDPPRVPARRKRRPRKEFYGD